MRTIPQFEALDTGADPLIRCNLHSVGEISGPGSVHQLVADAAERGHGEATVRLIRDWTQAGLLDYPQHRSAGKGHGSRAALYPENQRHLFQTLLHHRPQNGIRSLARIPVGIWMYWGEEFVPLRQVRRAMNTWLGDPRVSRRKADETAREVARLLDNPDATQTSRTHLRRTLSEIAYTGDADFEQLDNAVRAVFEPGARRLRRAVGHPAAPLTADGIVDLIRARLHAARRLADDTVDDDEFLKARHAHLVTYAQYAAEQAQYAAAAPNDKPDMYEPVTGERALNECCGNLLTALGLNSLYPERATAISRMPAPRITFDQQV